MMNEMKTRVLLLNTLSCGSPSTQRWLAAENGLIVCESMRSVTDILTVISRTSPQVIAILSGTPAAAGLDTTRMIMENLPLPVVIIDHSDNAGTPLTASCAYDAGAVALLRAPLPDDSEAVGEQTMADIRHKIRSMSEIRVVRRWPRKSGMNALHDTQIPIRTCVKHHIKVVAVGASTGGPQALRALLSGLPENFPVPVLVVQHISKGFLGDMTSWLEGHSGLRIRIAEHGVTAQAGTVYFAPDNHHLTINSAHVLEADTGDSERCCKPAASVLFRSVYRSFGQDAAAVLLSGMGRDGAVELGALHAAGAITFAQDAASCAVFGMPGAAVALGAATFVLPPEKIAAGLNALVHNASPRTTEKLT